METREKEKRFLGLQLGRLQGQDPNSPVRPDVKKKLNQKLQDYSQMRVNMETQIAQAYDMILAQWRKQRWMEIEYSKHRRVMLNEIKTIDSVLDMFLKHMLKNKLMTEEEAKKYKKRNTPFKDEYFADDDMTPEQELDLPFCDILARPISIDDKIPNEKIYELYKEETGKDAIHEDTYWYTKRFMTWLENPITKKKLKLRI